jgi:RNA polymerase sigma-70 factor (ECF subfamily)
VQDPNYNTTFESWLRQYSGVLYRIAQAYTRSAEDRDDLVQEILLQLWRSLPRFAGKSSPSTWIYRVALNTALAWNRSDTRRRWRLSPLIEADNIPSADPDSGAALHSAEVVRRLYDAIHSLSKVDAALVLLYLDDLSYREIAEVLGISEGNVGVKLNRARKQLAELMKEETHEPR